MVDGEFYLHRIPSIRIPDIKAINTPNTRQEIIGIHADVMLHEQMIGQEGASRTCEYVEQ